MVLLYGERRGEEGCKAKAWIGWGCYLRKCEERRGSRMDMLFRKGEGVG